MFPQKYLWTGWLSFFYNTRQNLCPLKCVHFAGKNPYCSSGHKECSSHNNRLNFFFEVSPEVWSFCCGPTTKSFTQELLFFDKTIQQPLCADSGVFFCVCVLYHDFSPEKTPGDKQFNFENTNRILIAQMLKAVSFFQSKIVPQTVHIDTKSADLNKPIDLLPPKTKTT